MVPVQFYGIRAYNRHGLDGGLVVKEDGERVETINPRLSTLVAVTKAVGLRLTVESAT